MAGVNRTRIWIHPDSSYRHYAFYLSGLVEVLGDPKVSFSRRRFPQLRDPTSGLALELADGRRVVIDAADHQELDQVLFEWCDIYGKVNVPLDLDDPKVMAIGPSFGVRWRSVSFLVQHMLRGAWATRQPLTLPSRLRSYVDHQRTRAALEAYTVHAPDPDYFFFLTNNWTRHAAVTSVRNRLTAEIPTLAGLRAEILTVGSGPECVQPIAHSEFISRTGRSVAALNTPAVHDCLGWKLGEYLALGKAIVSTPLTRRMPADFIHGVHAHFVEPDPAAVASAVELLRADLNYRERLERSAREYWQEHLTPERVARRLLG